jgi:predicted methyltransferase
LRPWFLLTVLVWANPVLAAERSVGDPALQTAIARPQRSEQFAVRDAARHPLAELQFFGITPSDAVVEIWPGNGYWTEILASYLHDRGTYYVAVPPGGAMGNSARQVTAFEQKLAADPGVYGKVIMTELGKDHYDIAPPGSLDLVLTFRNYHDWMPAGWEEEALAAFYKALKPGGIVGFEDHRARDDVAQDPSAKSGYVRQDYMIAMAKKAGFELLATSEMNANPKDTKDYPKGVWTLPPTYALGAQDRDKYAAIGEGDNMVLKFRKPTS